jgi:hypothetical protein
MNLGSRQPTTQSKRQICDTTDANQTENLPPCLEIYTKLAMTKSVTT